MYIKFGQYEADIDIEKTKQFYENADVVGNNCVCDGCLNFEKAVDTSPQAVKKFFDTLGIDMRKACECYVNCADNDGSLLYGGFYHVCGILLHGESAWRKTSETASCWDNKAAFSISPDFYISFQKDIVLLEKDFPLPVIQLEFLAKIPWVLKKENPYQ